MRPIFLQRPKLPEPFYFIAFGIIIGLLWGLYDIYCR